MFVGVGEAAYGSVGIAVVLTVFPARMRATMASAFMAGGLFGQVLGVGFGRSDRGGVWLALGVRRDRALRSSVITLVYPLVVREKWMKPVERSLQADHDPETDGAIVAVSAQSLREPIGASAPISAQRFQLYVAGTIAAWLPTYFTRYYDLGIGRAGSLAAALFLLTGGVGMVLCGMLSDRLAMRRPERKIDLAIFYCLACALLIFAAFQFHPGVMQLALLGAANFVAAGTTGPAGAMVANLTPRAIHGTAFATLTLANNLLGLAPGPALTGRLADSMGLVGALRVLPIACLLSMLAFLLARTSYRADLLRCGRASQRRRHEPFFASHRAVRAGLARSCRGSLANPSGAGNRRLDNRPAADKDRLSLTFAGGRSMRRCRRYQRRSRSGGAQRRRADGRALGIETHARDPRRACWRRRPMSKRDFPKDIPLPEDLADNGWLPIPRTPLPFPAIVAASRNDPLADFDRVKSFAETGRRFSSTRAMSVISIPQRDSVPGRLARDLIDALIGVDGEDRL